MRLVPIRERPPPLGIHDWGIREGQHNTHDAVASAESLADRWSGGPDTDQIEVEMVGEVSPSS